MTFAFKYMDEDTENDGNGQKSMVKAFLSLEIWQPLGKLTYVMYLIHLMVLEWWSEDLELPTYYTEWNELLLIIGIWIIVASIGLVLWFVVEKPLNNLVTLFMKCLVGLVFVNTSNVCHDQRSYLLVFKSKFAANIHGVC